MFRDCFLWKLRGQEGRLKMQLTKISYKTYNWELSNLELGKVNLIVGQNAVGKSRTLRAISDLADFFKSGWIIEDDINYFVQFSGAKSLEYNIETGIGTFFSSIKKEMVVIEGKTMIDRVKNKALVYDAIENRTIEFNPSLEDSIIRAYRDTKRYPYINSMEKWARQVVEIDFLKIESNLSSLSAFHKDIPELYYGFGKKSQSAILTDLRTIGFDFDNIEAVRQEQEQGFGYYLKFKEKGVVQKIGYNSLSTGLKRTVELLVYLEFILTQLESPTLIIDNFCEGLDYERAAKLGKLIFEQCKNSNIQLIAASNDNFLMDVIDIKHWNILQRNGSKVTAINERNSPEIFEKFRFIGLSNFDLLSSDFLQRHANE